MGIKACGLTATIKSYTPEVDRYAFVPLLEDGATLPNQQDLQKPFRWHGGKPVPKLQCRRQMSNRCQRARAVFRSVHTIAAVFEPATCVASGDAGKTFSRSFSERRSGRSCFLAAYVPFTLDQ